MTQLSLPTTTLWGRLFGEKNKPDAVTTAISRASKRLIEASQASPEEALQMLETTAAGLPTAEAADRLERYGLNEVAHEKVPAWYLQLLVAFANPFVAVLMTLAIVSYLLNVVFNPENPDWSSVIIISAMVLLSGLLRFWQEYRSNRAAQQLRALVRTTATVRRADGAKVDIPMFKLVPGDVVQLAAGDMIPADVRLLTSKDLFVSQAVLTGESLPVEKYDTLGTVVEKSAQARAAEAVNPLELGNICFMGTNVTSGTAAALVVATGSQTYFGSMSRGLLGQRTQTSFDKGVNSVSWLLIRFMLVMVPVVFVVNLVTKGSWFDALLFGLAVAVGITPEMLPMIVTSNLAKGALAMARHKTVVKRLNAIQNFGAMDVLCTDKTGTLTQDHIVLERYLDLHGDEKEKVLEYAYLNSYHQTGLKNLMDVAVLEYAEQAGSHHAELERRYRKIDEIPFDFVRRRMSVVLANGDGRHLLICKGAVEETLAMCAAVEDDGQVVPLTDALRQQIKSLTHDLNEDGLRVLVVAYKVMPPAERPYGVADETGLIMSGCIGFLDPPKETTRPALLALKEHGVAVKVLTGDNEVVTRKICRQVGLPVEAVLMGREVEALTDAELDAAVEHTTVFAKLAPLQKSRVIKALKRNGHTVGYLGDGINDAAALRDADVGISVDTAVDIAKESADIILLEKSLMVLEEGVVEGRKTFGNIIKYIKMTASSNFGNMFSVLGSSALLPFLPMLPLHVLINNQLYDLSQISIPWDSVDDEYLRKPRKWNANDIGRFMLFIGPISSIFDYTTYALMWFVFAANTPAHQALFQTGWFVESLLTQTLIIHVIRTRKIPFLQSTAALPVVSLTAVIMAAGILLPYTPIGKVVGMAPLPPVYFLWLLGTLLAYGVLTQLVKSWYIRRYHTWL
jgi:Mg2+-importing ATPase